MTQPAPPPPQASQKHTPKFELWVNVFIHQAFWNVINSLTIMEMTTTAAEGVMMTEAQIPANRLLGTVMVLESWILDQWRKDDGQFLEAKTKFDVEIQDLEQSEEGPTPLSTMIIAKDYFHQIIEVFARQEMLKVKLPRTLDEG